VHGVKAFLPSLLARGSATIVNVSSVFGLWGPPGQSAYAASKFAVRGFSESLAGRTARLGRPRRHRPSGRDQDGDRADVADRGRHGSRAGRAAARPVRPPAAHDPAERAARAILDGVAKRRDRVLIGADAYRIDWITRLLGPRGSRMLSNVMLRGIAKNAS